METSAHDNALSVSVRVRPHLFGIAYRMLSGAAEAEDIVQDVWLRWQATDRSVVLDRLQAARDRPPPGTNPAELAGESLSGEKDLGRSLSLQGPFKANRNMFETSKARTAGHELGGSV